MRKEKQSNQPTRERTLSGLLDPAVKLYVHLSDSADRADFMRAAELEGFHFGDGAQPTSREAGQIMALNDDKTISYLGFAGTMAFHNAIYMGERQVVRIDYKSYRQGDAYYFYGDLKDAKPIAAPRRAEASPFIRAGSAAFLIFDDMLPDNEAFFAWLTQEGYSFAPDFGAACDACWIYVNLNTKLATRGVPGIAVAPAVGNHAITIEEFKQIHAIFKKYAGLPPLKLA